MVLHVIWCLLFPFSSDIFVTGLYIESTYKSVYKSVFVKEKVMIRKKGKRNVRGILNINVGKKREGRLSVTVLDERAEDFTVLDLINRINGMGIPGISVSSSQKVKLIASNSQLTISDSLVQFGVYIFFFSDKDPS